MVRNQELKEILSKSSPNKFIVAEKPNLRATPKSEVDDPQY
jgi:hypothetical protein